MKKILLISIILLSFTVKSTTQLGTIYAKNKFINTNAFGSIVGAGSYFSVTANKLVVNGGPATAGYTRRIICDTTGMGDFAYSKWTYTVYTTIDNKGSGSDYVAFGITSNNATVNNWWLVFKFWTLTASAGKAQIISSSAGTGTTIRNTAGTAITVTAGVRYKFEMVRNENVITFTATNLSNSTTSVSTYTFNYSTAQSIYGQGKFSIYSALNTAKHSIDSINISIQNKIGIHSVLWGNSISQGYNATNIDSTYWRKGITQAADTNGHEYENLAIAGNRTQELLNSIQNIVTLAPTYAVIMIGVNDRKTGVSTATWQANLSSIHTTLTNAGIKIVWLNCTPCNSISVGIVNNYENGTLKALGDSTITVSYSCLWSGIGTSINASCSPDGTHLNDLGSRVLSNAIVIAAKYIY